MKIIIRTALLQLTLFIIVQVHSFGQSEAQIGNQVWLDNGEIANELDYLDSALSNILVSIYNATTNEKIDSIRTNDFGRYLFSVEAGNYYLGFEMPDDFALVSQNSGGDDSYDSDADPDTGFTEVFSVEANKIYLEYDAGYYERTNPSVANTEELFMVNNPMFIQYIMDGGSIGTIHNLSMFYRKDTIVGNRKFYQFCTVDFLENQPNSDHLKYLRFQGNRVMMHYHDQLKINYSGYLMLDFSLSLGDSFVNPFGESLVVVSKSIIDIGDGIERIHIELENANGEITEWIEGVGNTNKGFIGPKDAPYVLQKTIFEFVCKKDTFGEVYVLNEDLCTSMSCKQTNSYFSFDQDINEISFNNMSDNASAYYWDFGDGQNSTDLFPSHEYTQSGCYLVSLTAYDTCGITDVSSGFISICTDSSWLYQGPTTQLDDIYFKDDHAWYYKDNKLYKSNDNGNSWSLNLEIPFDTTEMILKYITDIYFYDDLTGYFTTRNSDRDSLRTGGIYTTSDGGQNWVASDAAPNNVYDFAGTTADDLYCLDQIFNVNDGHKYNIYHSPDRGQNWNLANEVDSIKISELFAFDNGTLLGVGFSRDERYQSHPLSAATTIYTSSDYGQSFDEKVIPYEFLFSYSYIAGHFFSAEEGFVLLQETENYYVHFLRYDYKLLYTSDGGDTWTDIDLPQHLEMYDIVFTDRQNAWITMKGGIVLRTIDGGQNWFNEYCVNTQTGFHLSATPSGSVYMSREDSTIFKFEEDPDFNCGIVLSERQIDFTVEKKENTAILNMYVQLDIDVKEIYIEHSLDGRNFELLSVFDYDYYRNNYDYQHINLAQGSNYYRLYFKDSDQKPKYSIIRHISHHEKIGIDISPNPFDDEIRIAIDIENYRDVKIQVFNADGKLILDNAFFENIEGPINVNTTALKSGIYFISVITDDNHWTEKMIKI